MKGTIRQLLEGVAGATTRRFLQIILEALGDKFSSCVIQNPGMVITGLAGTTAKTGATDLVYIAQGVPVSIAGGTALPALVGSIGAGAFGIFGFFGDKAGTITSAMGAQGATLSAARFPYCPEGCAIIGYLIVTDALAFTGGTTALDAATTIYCSPDGAFDPSVLVS